MSKKKDSIRAAAYIRKSTDGEQADGKRRQESSLPTQKAEIEKLAEAQNYTITKWYSDSGISGSREDRPAFQQMLKDAESRQFTAILVDDFDRFTRLETIILLQVMDRLGKCGVKVVHCCNQGRRETDLSNFLNLMSNAFEAHGKNEFLKNLSRRVTRSRRDKASRGERNGSPAPYGYRLAGKEEDRTLEFGDPGEVRTVKQIFSWYVDDKKSSNWIAGELNRLKIPTKRGRKWNCAGVRLLLSNPAYAGRLVYGRLAGGKFYSVSSEGEVKPVNELQPDEKPKQYVKDNAWPALVPPKQFDAAQKRMTTLQVERRRPRAEGRALSGGILVCGHCGRKLYAASPTDKKGKVIYRCPTPAEHGRASCLNYQISEHLFLPWLLNEIEKQMGKLPEVNAVQTMVNQIVAVHEAKQTRTADHQRRIEELEEARKVGVRNFLKFKGNKETQAIMQEELDSIAAELEQLRSEQPKEENPEWTIEEMTEMLKYGINLFKNAIWEEKSEDGQQMKVAYDAARLNDALHQLGTKATVWFEVTKEKQGKRTINRHSLKKVRLQLGQGQKPTDFSGNSVYNSKCKRPLRRHARTARLRPLPDTCSPRPLHNPWFADRSPRWRKWY